MLQMTLRTKLSKIRQIIPKQLKNCHSKIDKTPFLWYSIRKSCNNSPDRSITRRETREVAHVRSDRVAARRMLNRTARGADVASSALPHAVLRRRVLRDRAPARLRAVRRQSHVHDGTMGTSAKRIRARGSVRDVVTKLQPATPSRPDGIPPSPTLPLPASRSMIPRDQKSPRHCASGFFFFNPHF